MKKLLFSLLIYTGYLAGIILIASGYYLLQKDEYSVVRSLIQEGRSYRVVLITGEEKTFSDVRVVKEEGEVYLIGDGEKIPIFMVDRLDGIDLNSEVAERVSRYGIMGIILVVVGAFLFLISFLMRDHI
ncbi:MAG: hypothetical protein GXN94_03080 [Aquificae bacterium]|nr:hypothetical protein [Aquificota bacterium]